MRPPGTNLNSSSSQKKFSNHSSWSSSTLAIASATRSHICLGWVSIRPSSSVSSAYFSIKQRACNSSPSK
jgi:hypothetical protein